MAKDYTRVPRAEVDAAILRFVQTDRPFDVRPTAIGAVLNFAALLASTITASSTAAQKTAAQINEATFDSYVLAVAAKIDVPTPAGVPSDISTLNLASLSDAEARSLATTLELADWDWNQRKQSLSDNWRYWSDQVSIGRAAPTAAAYIERFRVIANYVRQKRGLADIPA